MASFHVKKNDEVVVLSGADKGKRGRVIAVLHKKNRVLVEGVRISKRHMRKSQQHPQGAIIDREAPIHISNVMAVTKFDGRAAKRGGGTEAKAETK
jgi:large subunit ribosomal protein L24